MVGLEKGGLYNGEEPPKEGDRKREKERTLSKIHYVNRKNTIRSNQFIQEHTPRTPSKTTHIFKNLLLVLEFTLWLCVLSSSDRFLIPISCCKPHYQPNSFTHSLTNLLYWAYWAHILFYLGLGYDLWPYKDFKKKNLLILVYIEIYLW